MDIELIKRGLLSQLPKIATSLRVENLVSSKEVRISFVGDQTDGPNVKEYDSALSEDEIIKQAVRYISAHSQIK